MSSSNKFYLIIIISFLLHLLCLNFYPINFEHSFAEAAKFIGTYDLQILHFYFEHQANTIIFPLFAGIINKIFFFLNSYQVTKLLSSFGYIFLAIGLLKFNRAYPISISINLLIFFTILNPLLWVYGYRGTPDFFSLAISFFAFSLIVSSINTSLKILGGFLLGFALIIKPMVGIFIVPTIFLILFNNNDFNFFNKIKNIVLITVAFAILPLLYFLIMWSTFNFLLLPHNEQIRGQMFVLNLFFFINNFILYSSFSFIFLFPFSVFYLFKTFVNINNNSRFLLISLSIIVFILGYLFVGRIEEMGFGPLDKLLDQKIKNGFFALGSLYFILLSIKIFKNENKKIIILTVYLYFIIMSFSLPAQRYIIVIFPLAMIIFSEAFTNRSINFFAFFLFVFINLLLLVNQYNSGIAAIKVVNFLKDGNIIKQTCPGVIESHAGNYFEILNKNCHRKFEIIQGIDPDDTFFTVRQKVYPGKIITYSVIKPDTFTPPHLFIYP